MASLAFGLRAANKLSKSCAANTFTSQRQTSPSSPLARPLTLGRIGPEEIISPRQVNTLLIVNPAGHKIATSSLLNSLKYNTRVESKPASLFMCSINSLPVLNQGQARSHVLLKFVRTDYRPCTRVVLKTDFAGMHQ